MEMAAACKECGVAIEEGAFLGLCTDCNQGTDDGAAAPVVSTASSSKSGLKLALIVGCGVFLIVVAMMLLGL
jgi:hypothetical protein